MKNLTLIHLVSEQTMQNLLPIMALRPARVSQVCSAWSGAASHAERVEKALRALRANPLYGDYSPLVECRRMVSESPSIAEVEADIWETIGHVGANAIVNFTGGTRLMSIGAWNAATRACAPVLYCDTQARRFVVERFPESENLPPFEQVVAALTVPVVLAAHGCRPDGLKYEAPSTEEVQFAEAMFEMWQHHEAELSDYLSRLRQIVYPGGALVKKSQVTEALENDLPPPPPNLEVIMDRAEAAGLVVRTANSFRFNVAADLNNDEKTRELKKRYQMMEGGWFEVLTFHRMKTSRRFLDVRMNVRSREEQVLGENDVVAIDLRRLAITFVSCKSSDSNVQPLEHVFALRQRATEFGGSHAGAFLCVRRCLNAQKRADLQLACRAARVEFIEGEAQFS